MKSPSSVTANEVVSGEPLFRERHVADYRRVFDLDPAIDTAKVPRRWTRAC